MTEAELLCTIIFVTFSIAVLWLNREVENLRKSIHHLIIALEITHDSVRSLKRKRDKSGRFAK